MFFKFIGDIKELSEGINIIESKYKYNLKASVTVNIDKKNSGLSVLYNGNDVQINYERKIDFFRAFFILIDKNEDIQNKIPFAVEETSQFNVCGNMIDFSRNAVMTVEGLKEWLINMAVIGLDMLMLYIEDTYEVPNYKYFGYMRGRYTKDELKEINSFAKIFGIQVVPNIQVLGHMARYLRWGVAKEIRDTPSVLLIREEKTYEFIEHCIATVSECFNSDYIHLGMDEAHDMGFGAFFNKYGYEDREKLFYEHLKKVCEIAKKYGKKPLIYSDMIFKLVCNGIYYDGVLENEVSVEDVELVYWDYCESKYESYIKMMEQHKKINSNIWFAGGIWTWSGNTVNYGKTFFITNTALKACKDRGIQNIYATLWGDGGVKTNHFQSLLGLTLFAEHKYYKNPTKEQVFEKFKSITGVEAKAFWDLSLLDIPSNYPEPDYNVMDQVSGAASVVLLYQDVLLGLFDKDYEGKEFEQHYKNLELLYAKYADEYKAWEFIFNLAKKQAKALTIKADCSRNILKAYKNGDKNELKKYSVDLLQKLIEYIYDLKNEHRMQWNKYYKPFGYEVLDIRYGGIIARISTAITVINDYLEGRIKNIPELEVERLEFKHDYFENNTSMNQYFLYSEIVSVSDQNT